MKNLFSRRVIFVSGKGGAGKTTFTCALAIAAAKKRNNVLILETRENDAIGSVFGVEKLTEKPLQLEKNIWGARIDPKTVLKEYIQKYVTFPFVSGQITGSRLFEHIASATPGLKEIMTLSQVWRFEKKKNSNSSSHAFDNIIVDSPATGHGLSLLRVPTTLMAMLQTGPIAEQTRWVNQMLRDPDKTRIVVAALPEELPVNETLEFCRKAQNDLEMHVETILVNMVYPEIFNSKEIAIIDNLEDPEDEKRRVLIEAAKRQIRRRKLQESHMKRLLEESEHPVIRVPYYYTNNLHIDQIKDIAKLLRVELNKLHEKPPC